MHNPNHKQDRTFNTLSSLTNSLRCVWRDWSLTNNNVKTSDNLMGVAKPISRKTYTRQS
jgi:hypothetical protein